MDSPESERLLGNVQGSLDGLKDAVERVLDNQESARREAIAHAATDESSFSLIREGLGGLRDRITRLESMADTVESHGDAILTMESRLNAADQAKSLLEREQAVNRRWQKGFVGVAGAVGGGIASKNWAALWKAVTTLFHSAM